MFPFINLICTLIAAALWYLFPELGGWPLVLGLLPWIVRLLYSRQLLIRTPLDWPIGLFLVTAVASVWAAHDRETALAKFWLIVGAILLYYAFVALLSEQFPKQTTHTATDRIPQTADFHSAIRNPQSAFAQGETAVWLLTLFSAILSLYFLATHEWDAFTTKFTLLTQWGRHIQTLLPTLPGHRLHPNVVGGMLAMLLPFCGAATWLARQRKSGLLMAGGLGIIFISLFSLLLSASRGAWIAFVAAVALALLWGGLAQVSHNQPRRRRWLFLGLIGLGILAGAIIFAVRPVIINRLVAALPGVAGGQSRLDLYRNSLILVQEYPFIGAGLGGFMMLYSTYSFLIHVGYIIHAHNLFLNVAIEQGLIALFMLFWMWTWFGKSLWQAAKGGRIAPLPAAAALSLITILLHGLVEDALYGSRAILLLFIPLAFVISYRLPEKPYALRTTHYAILAGLVVLGLVIWRRPLLSSVYSNLAAVQQSRAELSLYSWPEWPLQDEVRRKIDLTRPINNYEQALALNPQNTAANRRLGMIELSLGRYADALTHLQVAYEQMAWDNGTRQLYGEGLIVNGRSAAGSDLWATVNNAQGQLDARTFWYQHIGDPGRLNLEP